MQNCFIDSVHAPATKIYISILSKSKSFSCHIIYIYFNIPLYFFHKIAVTRILDHEKLYEKITFDLYFFLIVGLHSG